MPKKPCGDSMMSIEPGEYPASQIVVQFKTTIQALDSAAKAVPGEHKDAEERIGAAQTALTALRETTIKSLKAVESDRDSLRAKLAEAEAGAAQMRSVVEEWARVLTNEPTFCNGCKTCTDTYIRPQCYYAGMRARVQAALSTSSGRDFLEHHNEAEALLRRTLWRDIQTDACRTDKSKCHSTCEHYITCQEIDAYLKGGEVVQKVGLKCAHGILYPSEGDPKTGPWECNPDGSNPACPNCFPDAWKEDERIGKAVVEWVHNHVFNPSKAPFLKMHDRAQGECNALADLGVVIAQAQIEEVITLSEKAKTWKDKLTYQWTLEDRNQFRADKLAEMPKEVLYKAIETVIGMDDSFKAHIRGLYLRAKEKVTWFTQDNFHFLGGGMFVRNTLRGAGLPDDLLPSKNWDDYYIPVIEIALGFREAPKEVEE